MAHASPQLIEPRSLADAIELVGAWIITALQRTATSGRRFRLVLTGGTTPAPLYDYLARQKDVDWTGVDWFWSDERAVPPDDEESNYHLVRAHLLDHVVHDPGRVFRLQAERRPIELAASVSEDALNEAIGQHPFDFTLLGMGPDGHIASLFPQHDELSVTSRSVVAVRASPKPPAERLSLSLRRLNNSERIVVLTSGPGKLAIARAIAAAPDEGFRWPASHLAAERTIFVCAP